MANSPAPKIEAVRLQQQPGLDGEVLGDRAWQHVPIATGFQQTAPDEGAPASQRTEVRVGFFDQTLFIGVVCYDQQPEQIIVADSRRDASLSDTDSFQIILDTFRDRQSGFVFGTNPSGLEYDGQVTKEGAGRFNSGSGGFNLNWDASWTVEAKRSAEGWSAEFAIPFKTLRYQGGEIQEWGINFQRNIRRRNETAYWAPLPRQYNLYRLSLAGTLQGVEPPPQRNFKVMPYALTTLNRSDGVAGSQSDSEIGFDLKYSITPALTLDATYNTDFAQVEADELQVNLDRFSLFFPEKRPFFLENAGQFAVGVPGEVELFFSRRIGIGPQGEAVPIDGGLRLSGKMGAATNVGLLQMRSEGIQGLVSEYDYTVARVSRELPNRSSIGGLVVSRRGDDLFFDQPDRNETYALDARWGVGENTLFSGFVAQTDTPGIDGDEHAFRLAYNRNTEAWSSSASYTEVGAGFNPEVGFLARSDYRKADVFFLRRYRPADLWGLQELRPHISYRGFWNSDGFHQSGFLHIDNHFEWKSGFEVHTGVNFTREGLRQPFEISDGIVVPSGTYDHSEAALVLFTNEGAPMSFRINATLGGFFGGNRVALSPSIRYRASAAFRAELSWNHNDIDLPGGDFETNLGRLRMSYSFSPKMLLQGLVQYSDRDDVLATNVRFSWLRQANSGLFLVYNEIEETPNRALSRTDRTLTVKYSHIFDL